MNNYSAGITPQPDRQKPKLLFDMETGSGKQEAYGRRVVVVGVCGSGKSVLAQALRERGWEAESVAQEHSQVPDLFLHPQPDIVIFLEASDATVAQRKRTGWEPHLLEQQRHRLALAREQAHIRLITDGLTPAELLEKAEAELAHHF